MTAIPKPQRLRDSAYLKWIRMQPCNVPIVDMVDHHHDPIEASHILTYGGGKVGSKTDDKRAVPHCGWHHRRYHGIGRAAFESYYGIDHEREILRLNKLYTEQTRTLAPRKPRKSSPRVIVEVQHCEACGGEHRLPSSKVDVRHHCESDPLFERMVLHYQCPRKLKWFEVEI